MQTNVFTWHNLGSAMGSTTKEYAMDNDQELDNQGNPINWREVMTKWVTISEAAETIGMSRQAVHDAITAGKLRAVWIEETARGYWKLHPGAVDNYERRSW